MNYEKVRNCPFKEFVGVKQFLLTLQGNLL